jgi:hypothetical protein
MSRSCSAFERVAAEVTMTTLTYVLSLALRVPRDAGHVC